MILGAHVPMAGGLDKAPARGAAIGADAIQIFTRSQLQWRAEPIRRDEAVAFRAAVAASGLGVVVAHGSYLVNLASPDPEALARSRAAFVADMERCHALGIRWLIFHPGAHMGAGEAVGLATIAASLDHVIERAQAPDVHPTLEVTAGQGSSLGHRFEQIAAILARMKRPGTSSSGCGSASSSARRRSAWMGPRGFRRTCAPRSPGDPSWYSRS